MHRPASRSPSATRAASGPEIVARGAHGRRSTPRSPSSAPTTRSRGCRRRGGSRWAHGARGSGERIGREASAAARRAPCGPAGSPATRSSAAARLALAGEVDAIVTAPVDKHALHLAGFPYPGHTEWLGAPRGRRGRGDDARLRRLRVVLVTTHVALRDVPALLTTERVVPTGRITRARAARLVRHRRAAARALRAQPARRRGRALRRRGGARAPARRRAAGRRPARSRPTRCSCARMRGEFDAVLAPYHDVGMTAIKVATFGRGGERDAGPALLRDVARITGRRSTSRGRGGRTRRACGRPSSWRRRSRG